MKHTAFYYLALIVPFALIILLFSFRSEWRLIALLFFWIYKALLDGQRLIAKGALPPKHRWKSFIPFFTVKYRPILFTNKQVVR